MRLTSTLLTLRRRPKRNSIFGVHWTQWPWPSLVAGAIYRRFGPQSTLTQETRTAYAMRASFLHFVVGSTVLSAGVAYYYYGGKKTTTLTAEQAKKRMGMPEEVQAVAALVKR